MNWLFAIAATTWAGSMIWMQICFAVNHGNYRTAWPAVRVMIPSGIAMMILLVLFV